MFIPSVSTYSMRISMGNNTQPEFSRSRRRDVKGEYVKSPRTWSEKQELRGYDLTAIARAYQARTANLSRESQGEEPDYLTEERDTSPRDESLEAWVRQLERREEEIDFLFQRVDSALNPFMARWLTPETVEELVAMLMTLLPSAVEGSYLHFRLQRDLERLTTWTGLGEYLERLAEAKRFEEQLVEERTRRLEATSRRPRTRPGNRR